MKTFENHAMLLQEKLLYLDISQTLRNVALQLRQINENREELIENNSQLKKERLEVEHMLRQKHRCVRLY